MCFEALLRLPFQHYSDLGLPTIHWSRPLRKKWTCKILFCWWHNNKTKNISTIHKHTNSAQTMRGKGEAKSCHNRFLFLVCVCLLFQVVYLESNVADKDCSEVTVRNRPHTRCDGTVEEIRFCFAKMRSWEHSFLFEEGTAELWTWSAEGIPNRRSIWKIPNFEMVTNYVLFLRFFEL